MRNEGRSHEEIYTEWQRNKVEGHADKDKFKMDPVKSSKVVSEIRKQIAVSRVPALLPNGWLV